MCYVVLKILENSSHESKKIFSSRSRTFLPSRSPLIPSISPLFDQENDNHVVWETGSHVTILEKITKRTNRMSYLSKKEASVTELTGRLLILGFCRKPPLRFGNYQFLGLLQDEWQHQLTPKELEKQTLFFVLPSPMLLSPILSNISQPTRV
ncbi:hypothetical protein CEXT_6871 [Caerostris extrusa]|uniref:Uncharacterized protein n=1 Tax=Caerostris extrusa TaxID=172846 RepID=A0AAV4V912_CAEEX|nr:hypothetical protein CEXT_6871 [Caerostris extrusa]